MRNEKGSITLFVLVSMLFFLIIATTAYVSASSKLQGQNEELAQIKASYEQNLGDEELLQLYNKVSKTREWLPGSGTQEDSYKIYTIEDLVTFSKRSNNGEFNGQNIYVELMNDLDFSQDSSYVKASRTDFGDVNDDGTPQELKQELITGTGFPCIAVIQENAFTGTFEGNGHEIRNLLINVSDDSINSAFFGTVNNSTIENLDISGQITKKDGSNVAGIVGTGFGNTQIIKCHNKANIIRKIIKGSVGGIIGVVANGSNITINECYNTGSINMLGERSEVSGWGNTGGLIGLVNGTLILSKSYNNGNIESEYGYHTGGLIGRDNDSQSSNITIIDCYNSGNVTSKIQTGGLIGYVLKNVVIYNSYNKGNISGEMQRSGGIIASAIASSNIRLNNVFNYGNISDNNKDAIISLCLGNNNFVNCYYENNNTYNGYGATHPDIITKLEQSQMQASSFVDTLNANKNSINLSDYGLSDYTLSSWKQGVDGYPEFDW